MGTVAASVKRDEEMKVKLCCDMGRRKGRWKETKTSMSRIVPETQKQQMLSNRGKKEEVYFVLLFFYLTSRNTEGTDLDDKKTGIRTYDNHGTFGKCSRFHSLKTHNLGNI